MQFTRTFHKVYDAYKLHPRYIDSEGGTRSGKTYSILQLLILLAMGDKTPTITSVVSETMPHLKRGAIRDFKDIMVSEHLWNEDAWSRSESIYTFPNGSIIEFFSVDQPSKVQGPARDRLFVNEAVNVSYATARQLFARTKKLIIVDYNPTHAFWMHEHIAPRPNCVHIHSTYLDNDFLSPEQVAEIESNKDDKNWWRVYGEGLVGQLEGLIYDFEQIDEMPQGLSECAGMDFGFSNDPTALVRLAVDTGRKAVYADELIYRTRMLNSDIIDAMRDKGIDRTLPVYADCAEPKSIEEIHRAGFNIIPCDKDAPVRSDKLLFQIQWVQGWKLYVTKRSVNMIKELRNYCWDKDKDGNLLNRPIDTFNHILDAFRYGLYSRFGKDANKGHYTISIIR